MYMPYVSAKKKGSKKQFHKQEFYGKKKNYEMDCLTLVTLGFFYERER